MKEKEPKHPTASRLSIAREQAGLSQSQVARIMNLHRPTISEIEAGRRNVTTDEIKKLAEIYDVSVNWLLCLDDENPNPIDDQIKLAARELSKLKKDDLNKVIALLKAIRR